MTVQPFVSVIICVYKVQDYITETLEGVRV